MLSLLAYFPFLAVALIAQWSDRYRPLRWVTYGLLLLFDALAVLEGLLALRIGQSQEVGPLFLSQYPNVASLRWDVFGLVLVVTACLSAISLLPLVRRGLARLIPIDPESGVHVTALALAVLGVGLNLSQVPLIGGLSVLADSAAQVGFLELLASNLPIVLFAFVGVGFLIRRTPRETWGRLGLERVTWRHIGLAVGLALVVSAFYYGVDWIWRTLDTESYEMVEALSDVLYGGAMGTWQGVTISMVAGVTEELFFRGAVQPRFGLLLTAVFFTAAHVQYGLTPATLEVFVGALLLGWLRQRANTGTCILLHMLYNIAALLIFPFLP
jgi:membrane protease YdiL (CAAX protease family)